MTARSDRVRELAERLRLAEQRGVPIPLIFGDGGRDLALAYAIQRWNIDHGLNSGRRLVGRKIGLTDRLLQEHLGISAPICGALFADMKVANGGKITITRVMAAKAEPEVALVFGCEVTAANPTVQDILDAVAFALPALEIIGSRFPPGDATVADDVADNAGSGMFVAGAALPGSLASQQALVMTIGGERWTPARIVKARIDWDRILAATAWLGGTMAAEKTPLRAGDIVLTGAVTAEMPVRAGDWVAAAIDDYPAVSVSFIGPND